MKLKTISIYTDGSAHVKLKFGAWAAIILLENNKTIIKGTEANTSHNRMEVLAVLKAISYLSDSNIKFDKLIIYTDSQYVERIPQRMDKLLEKNFITKKGKLLNNTDLLKQLIHYIQSLNIKFVKVKAHQKDDSEITKLNNEVDRAVRSLMRREKNL